MFVQLGDYKVSLEIEKKKNKNIYFRFKDDGTLFVTCNKFFSEKEILKIIQKNEKSLLKMYETAKKKQEKNLSFYYLGKPYTKVFDENVKKVYIEDDMIYAKNSKQLEKWYKEECFRVFSERIDECLTMFKDIPKFSLKIRMMKTRWGVNNVTKRVITLNSELLKKDVSLIDYVIIHEICHFYEANHSSRFWKQVDIRYPDYKLARKRLRVE
ncbi:MAG: M48 family metallopeptidase [Candidatus Coprovivens sp.]